MTHLLEDIKPFIGNEFRLEGGSFDEHSKRFKPFALKYVFILQFTKLPNVFFEIDNLQFKDKSLLAFDIVGRVRYFNLRNIDPLTQLEADFYFKERHCSHSQEVNINVYLENGLNVFTSNSSILCTNWNIHPKTYLFGLIERGVEKVSLEVTFNEVFEKNMTTTLDIGYQKVNNLTFSCFKTLNQTNGLS